MELCVSTLIVVSLGRKGRAGLGLAKLNNLSGLWGIGAVFGLELGPRGIRVGA